MDDIDCADTDVILVEYGDSEDDFIFEIKKIEFREARCDWCSEKKLLCVSCVCKNVNIGFNVIRPGIVMKLVRIDIFRYIIKNVVIVG